MLVKHDIQMVESAGRAVFAYMKADDTPMETWDYDDFKKGPYLAAAMRCFDIYAAKTSRISEKDLNK